MAKAKWRAPKLLPATEVPDFSSEEEAAEWYDTHDTSELPSEPVEPYPGSENWPRGFETLTLRLPAFEVEELKRRARGISWRDYVRVLINHHVLKEPPLP